MITGGASGIGEATCRRFVGLGASVIVADIDAARASALADELGDRARAVVTDVTSEDDVSAAVAAAVDTFGALDVMFNNAGRVGPWQPIDEVDVDEWDRTIAVLARSVLLGIKHAARVMKPAGHGSIVNTASVAAVRSGFGPHPYGAAKAAILQLTRSAATELAEHRIRVNTVIPGGIATRINGHAAGLAGDDLDRSVDRMRDGLARFQPYPRAGEPDDIAGLVAFLASEAAEFITGETIRVDGGLLAGRPFRPPRDRAES